MPALMRPRICCFYCGKRTQYLKGQKIRKFDCPECEATNFLDEHGDIADVPTTPTTTQRPTFVTTRPVSNSPPAALSLATDTSNPLFCSLCLKNQHFLTQCLANYLPPETDPRYAKFVEEFPQYKKQLEQRYPPVCPNCEPRVRERLRKSAYAAKSDILTRSLARPSNDALVLDGNPLYKGVLSVIDAAWWSSLIIQVVWHVLCVVGKLDIDEPAEGQEGVRSTVSTASLCIVRSLRDRAMPPYCAPQLAHLVYLSLGLGLAVCWYNPGMRTGRRGRTEGKNQYYQLQLIMLLSRFCAWWLLTRGALGSIAATRGLHAFMTLLLSLTMILSRRLIVAALPAKPSFRNVDVPLVDKESFRYPDDQFTSQPSAHRPVQQSTSGLFPMNNLAPRGLGRLSTTSTTTATSTVREPPTPPESVTEQEQQGAATPQADTMDWEPVTAVERSITYDFRPRTRESMQSHATLMGLSSSSARTVQPTPSPFYGQLPAAPKSMEHRLRNAANNPAPQFHPVPESKQQDWFQRMRLANSSWASKDYVKSMPKPEKRQMDFAESKWTLQSDLDATTRGTGLEDLFTSSFKLEDDGATADDVSVRTAGTRNAERPLYDGNIVARLSSWLVLSLVLGIAAVLIGAFRNPYAFGAFGHRAKPAMDRLREYAYGET